MPVQVHLSTNRDDTSPMPVEVSDGQASMSEPAIHADVVGSLLRPDWLLAARQKHEAGDLSSADFKAAEDRAVDEAIALQEGVGLPVLSDGEMRRLSFQAQLPAAVEGFGAFDLDAFLWGDWRGDSAVGDQSVQRPPGIGITGPPSPAQLPYGG